MRFKLVEEYQYNRNKKRLPDFSHADLLTVEEAEKLPQKLRKHTRWWWLRSPGLNSGSAAIVLNDGYVYDGGNDVYGSDDAVRPALRITNLNDYKVGSLFKFGGKWFQIVDENTAFCLSNIGIEKFDDKINDYNNSYIKRYIDNWFSENIQKIKQ